MGISRKFLSDFFIWPMRGPVHDLDVLLIRE
jgi:hypothetical protein